MVPCAPCLESVPCDKGHVCRLPFADPALVRLLGGSAKPEPPAGWVEKPKSGPSDSGEGGDEQPVAPISDPAVQH